MISLYIDTSTKYLCLGLAKNYQVFYKYQQEALMKQSELSIPTLEKILKENDLSLNDVDEVSVTIGPGSFTGIRIGMCIAKVLASVRNIPLKAVCSLNAYANIGKKIILLDAKAKRAYIGIYNNNQKIIDENVLEIEQIKQLLVSYPDYDVDLDSHLVDRVSNKIDVIENMNRVCKNINPIDNVDNLVPIYLKDR